MTVTNNAINAPLPLAPIQGGSGLISPTAHGVLIAEGSSNYNPIVIGPGELLIGTTASDPVSATLTAGSRIAITSVSGSITISSTTQIPITPTDGGTGLSDPTAHALLIAQGASPMNLVLLGAGELLIGTTSGDPVNTTLTAGQNIAISSSSGVIAVSFSGILPPTNGGTGLSDPAPHGILITEGSSDMNLITLGAGELLIGTTGSDPVNATLTPGQNIAISSTSGIIAVSFSGVLPATNGGTGIADPMAHGIMVAEGSDPMNPIILNDGELLIGSTGNDPIANTLSAGQNIDIISSSGDISIALTGIVSPTNGGTGVSDPSVHGIMIAEGSFPMNPIVLNDGELLIGFNGGDPIANTLTAGSRIGIVSAPGSITISSTTAIPITPADGGTGISSPTAHALLIAEGSSPMNLVTLGAGELLIGTTASDPVNTTLTAGQNIDINSTSGAISIAFTGILPAINGGTGVSSPTAHGILIAEGSSPMSSIVLSDGELLIGVTGSDPSANTLTAGQNIAIINGSGSISIGLTGIVSPTNGGTGVSDPTAHGIMIAEGSSAMNSIILSDGELLIGSSGSDPIANTLTAAQNIEIINSSGFISVGFTGILPTINGGTGVAAPATHGIMVAEGTSPMVAIQLNDGELLIGSGGNDPVPSTLSAGQNIDIISSSGSILIELAGVIPAANGGTGLSNPTAHGIMVGEGLSPMTPIVLTNGQLLIGSTGNNPVGATLTAGTNIAITSGSGTISIGFTGIVSPTHGGTGVADPTAHGIMIAEGSSPINPIVLSDGELLIGSSGNDPVAANLNAGSGISITNNPGSVTISSTLTLPVSSTNGGTGVSNPTAHGIMVAEGASPMNSIILSSGQLLIGSTGNNPVAATLTAGTGISIVNAAGSITISSTAPLAPVSPTNGGTGVADPTAHGIMVAEGSSPMNPIILSDGELLIGSTGIDPVAAALTAGSNISITNGAGTITVAATGVPALPVSATNGGTGVSNPTIHGVMVAQGAAAIHTLTMTNGQVLIGSTGVDPVSATLTAGARISIAQGAGSITISSSAPPAYNNLFATGVSGTFTPGANTKSMLVEVIGGGGGGGAAPTSFTNQMSAGGGGGAGGYVRALVTSPSGTYSYSVGAGGAGGTSGGNGGTGGSTSFGGFMTGGGGTGGAGGPIVSHTGGTGGAAGDGGTATGGIGAGGAYGFPGICYDDNPIGGNGANSYFGGGGKGGQVNSVSATNANAAGAGGGGSSTFTASGVNGGNGGGGILIVSEFT